jgi:hypothetical protein
MGYILSVFDSLAPEEELFRFEVSSIAKTVWGIRGRVTVRTKIATARTVPTRGGYVTTETLDFLSGRSRQQFAERLSDLIPSPPGGAAIDWPVIVEGLVAGVMDSEHRQPVIHDLSVTPAVAYTPHLIPYLLPEGKTTILYGAGGTGKSAFAAAMASAIQTGARILGWTPIQRNVLYLDWETDEGDVAHRIGATSRGLGLHSAAPVRYMALELPLEMEMAHIAAAVAENNIGLVIIDSVGMASNQGRDGSDPAESAIQFFRALRILNATVLCIDHISGDDMRKGRSGASKPYGSVFKWNSARNAFELIDAGVDLLILRHRKANLGPKMDGGELTMSVRWDNMTDVVSYRRVTTSVPTFTTAERMKAALVTGPGSYKTLIDVLNADQMYDVVNEAELRVASRELLASGSIAIDHQGVIRLTQDDPVELTPDNTIPLALEDVDHVE